MIEVAATPAIGTILEDFAFLDDWEDRYRYVIELGRTLAPLPDDQRNAKTKVEGCASQVWLVSELDESSDPPVMRFAGDSDAHIVKGLVAILMALYSGQTPPKILAIDAPATFSKLGLDEHLSSQRANGLASMIKTIRHHASLAAHGASA